MIAATVLADSINDVVVTGALAIDLDGKTVTVAGQDIVLTRREWDLLAYLAGRLGKFCDLDDVFWRVFAPDMVVGRSSSTGSDHRVRVVIERLRSKLGSAGSLIETRYGFGYRLHREHVDALIGGAT